MYNHRPTFHSLLTRWIDDLPERRKGETNDLLSSFSMLLLAGASCSCGNKDKSTCRYKTTNRALPALHIPRTRLRSDAVMRCANEKVEPEACFTSSSALASAGARPALVGFPLPEGVSGDIGMVRIALEAALAMPGGCGGGVRWNNTRPCFLTPTGRETGRRGDAARLSRAPQVLEPRARRK